MTSSNHNSSSVISNSIGHSSSQLSFISNLSKSRMSSNSSSNKNIGQISKSQSQVSMGRQNQQPIQAADQQRNDIQNENAKVFEYEKVQMRIQQDIQSRLQEFQGQNVEQKERQGVKDQDTSFQSKVRQLSNEWHQFGCNSIIINSTAQNETCSNNNSIQSLHKQFAQQNVSNLASSNNDNSNIQQYGGNNFQNQLYSDQMSFFQHHESLAQICEGMNSQDLVLSLQQNKNLNQEDSLQYSSFHPLQYPNEEKSQHQSSQYSYSQDILQDQNERIQVVQNSQPQVEPRVLNSYRDMNMLNSQESLSQLNIVNQHQQFSCQEKQLETVQFINCNQNKENQFLQHNKQQDFKSLNDQMDKYQLQIESRLEQNVEKNQKVNKSQNKGKQKRYDMVNPKKGEKFNSRQNSKNQNERLTNQGNAKEQAKRSVSRSASNSRITKRANDPPKVPTKIERMNSDIEQIVVIEDKVLKEGSNQVIELKKAPNGSYTFSNTLNNEETEASFLEAGLKLNNVNQSFTSRNMVKQTAQIQQASQSTLCNVASVQKQGDTQTLMNPLNQALPSQESFDTSSFSHSKINPLNLRSSHDNVKCEALIQDLSAQVQLLSSKLQIQKDKSKQEKQETIQKLKQIEDNYQKYAFYYTKYLEDKVLIQEYDTKVNEYEEVIQGQQVRINQSEQLISKILSQIESGYQKDSLSNDILKIIKSFVDENGDSELVSKVQRLQSLQPLQSQDHEEQQQIQKSNQSPSKSQQEFKFDINQPYSSSFHNRAQSQQFSHSKSNQRKRTDLSAGRSSTPKTQMRYQEPKEDSEEDESNDFYHYQHFPSAIDFSAEVQLPARNINNHIERRHSILSPTEHMNQVNEPSFCQNAFNNLQEDSLRVSKPVSQCENISGGYQASQSLFPGQSIKGSQSSSRQSLLSQLPLQMKQEHLQNYSKDSNANNIGKNIQQQNQSLNSYHNASIYEYTLQNDSKNCYQDEQKIEVKPRVNQNNQKRDEETPEYNVGLAAFTKEIMNSISKLDTFSPNLIEQRQQEELKTNKISDDQAKNFLNLADGQIKYSIEYINEKDHESLEDSQDRFQDSQSTNDLVKTSEKSNPKRHLGFSQVSLHNISEDDQCKMLASTNDLDKFKISTQQLQELSRLSHPQGIPTTAKSEINYCQERSQIQSMNSLQPTVSGASQSSSRSIEIAIAIQPFRGEKEQDLPFKVGEKIIVEQKIKGSSWLYGSIGMKSGWFPASCVKIQEHFIS